MDSYFEALELLSEDPNWMFVVEISFFDSKIAATRPSGARSGCLRFRKTFSDEWNFLLKSPNWLVTLKNILNWNMKEKLQRNSSQLFEHKFHFHSFLFQNKIFRWGQSSHPRFCKELIDIHPRIMSKFKSLKQRVASLVSSFISQQLNNTRQRIGEATEKRVCERFLQRTLCLKSRRRWTVTYDDELSETWSKGTHDAFSAVICDVRERFFLIKVYQLEFTSLVGWRRRVSLLEGIFGLFSLQEAKQTSLFSVFEDNSTNIKLPLSFIAIEPWRAWLIRLGCFAADSITRRGWKGNLNLPRRCQQHEANKLLWPQGLS